MENKSWIYTILGGVLAFAVMLAAIPVLFEHNTTPGGNTPVSWVMAPIESNSTDQYYYRAHVEEFVEGVPFSETINNPNGTVRLNFINADSELIITGGNVHLVIIVGGGGSIGTVDWSQVTQGTDNQVSINIDGTAGENVPTEIMPAWNE